MIGLKQSRRVSKQVSIIKQNDKTRIQKTFKKKKTNIESGRKEHYLFSLEYYKFLSSNLDKYILHIDYYIIVYGNSNIPSFTYHKTLTLTWSIMRGLLSFSILFRSSLKRMKNILIKIVRRKTLRLKRDGVNTLQTPSRVISLINNRPIQSISNYLDWLKISLFILQ